MNIKQWIVGITGGIAAYKTPELIRLLKKQGADVRVVLSQGAKSFVTPLTLQAVSGHRVYSELLDCDFEAAMGHIELARWAQGILIAPLSANRLASLAMGMADDLLTTLCLASKAPMWIAPAMNQAMWHHPATQAHLETLKSRNVQILGPDWGEQACGDVGLGRMLEPQDILSQLLTPANSFWQGKRVLITAGPTQEAIDPVRFLSNKSSGKMGFALAKAAASLGAQVTLITGPVSLEAPHHVQTIRVTSANEMLQAVLEKAPQAQLFISAAAVADFCVASVADQKIKKNSTNDTWALALVANPDILATVKRENPSLFCVGFAAETEHWEENAKKKLIAKQLDLIAVNDVSRNDIGFDADDNALTVFSKDKTYSLSKNNKYKLSLQLLEIVSECYHAKNKTENIRSTHR